MSYIIAIVPKMDWDLFSGFVAAILDIFLNHELNFESCNSN